MEKHIFGTKYYIRDKYIKIAKSRNLKLVIKTPDGIATYTASAWMDGADRMEKVFNFPDRPMILFGKHIKKDVLRRDKRKKIEKRLNQDYNLKGYGQLLRAWKEVQNKI